MRRDKIISGLIAWILALATALAGIGCVVTGFDLDITGEWGAIILSCALFAAVAAVCCSFRWGAPVMTGLSLIALLLKASEVLLSAGMLIYRISTLFNSGYGWGVINPFEYSSAIPPEYLSSVPSFAPALIVLGCLVISAVCWVVCRRRWVGFGLLAGLAPLVLCCVLTNTVPDTPYLSLLIGSLLMLTLTQLVRRRDIRSGNRVAAIVLIPVLLLSMILPQYAQNTDLQQQAQQLQDFFLQWWHDDTPENPGNTGTSAPGTVTSDPIDLQQIGPMQQTTKRVMTVQSEYSGVLYLRGAAYDAYTGTSWVADADTGGEGGWPTNGLTSIGTLKISQKNGATDMRFFPYYILKSEWTDHLTHGMLVYSPRQETYSYELYALSEQVQYTALNSEETALYLALPQATQRAAARILDQLFGDQELSDNEKAALIAEYVSTSADYDLMTEKMPESADDFALWFLEESDTGYCVHFASAAAVLLRAAGIPARYVTGYLTYSTGKTLSSVTADQAHAWVEYLNPDCGWSVLEATPGAAQRIEPTAPPETTEPPTEPPVTTDPTEDSSEPSGSTTVPSENTGVPSENTTKPTAATPPQDDDPSVNLTWVWYVLCALLAWSVLALQHRLRRRIRQKWLMQGDEKQRALRRWRYVRRAVRILKLPYPEHLQALAEKAVFSQHTLTSDELAQFDKWLRKAKRTLLTKPWPIRLALWLLYAI